MPLTLLEGVGGLVSLGNVAGDLGEADEFIVLIKGVDHNRREELRTVLAHAPSLRLEPSGLASGFERVGRLPRLAILRGVEHLEVPADNFVCLVSLDAFGAGIPVNDDAVGIEHVDGVVDDSLDQQAKLALAFEQTALATSLFRHLIFSRRNLA